MDPRSLLALVALINSVVNGVKALEGVRDLIENARAQGRTVTFDELKGLSLGVSEAQVVLAAAIEEAE